jgi:integrase/recombinase XerD
MGKRFSKIKQRNRKLPRWLREDQVKRLFDVANNDRDRILMKLMFYCGLRCAEALNLRKSDFDFVDGTVFIRQGKGNKDRLVPVPKILYPELKEYMKNKEKLFDIGTRHTRRIVKMYSKKSKIQNYETVHPHTLRHSYATFLLNKGVPLLTISRFLGHSDINMTTIYTHMSMKKGKEIIDQVF